MEELYRIAAQPAIQTSTVVNPIDMSHTKNAKFVYIKVDEPKGLAPWFEDPYAIVSRPSRSTIQVRIGSFADGTPRLQEYNWNSCKIAHLREGAQPSERPRLGRPPASAQPQSSNTTEPHFPLLLESQQMPTNNRQIQNDQSGDGQAAIPPPLSPEAEPSVSNLPVPATSNQNNARPVRSTRNPSPQYVH